MYVADMSLEEAKAWEKKLEMVLTHEPYHPGLSKAFSQTRYDLEDVRERIAELEA